MRAPAQKHTDGAKTGERYIARGTGGGREPSEGAGRGGEGEKDRRRARGWSKDRNIDF